MRVTGHLSSRVGLRNINLPAGGLATAALLALIMSILPATASASTSPAAVTTSSSPAAVTWTQARGARQPGAMAGAAMAYDAATSQLVLYGGAGPGGNSSATWVWNGAAWTEAEADSPPGALSDARMAFNASDQQLFLYGGTTDAGANSDQTWLWNGKTWTLAAVGTQADGLSDASMAYDAQTQQLVLFGGRPGSGAAAPASATWVWQGTDTYWNQYFPSTSPGTVAGAPMAYDTATSQLVLFGGDGSPPGAAATWLWNGTNWTDQSTSTNPGQPYYDGSMAYDAMLNELVLYGGTTGTGYLAKTWAWTGTDWTRLRTLGSPGAVARAAMAYDPATDQLVLYGGIKPGNKPSYSDQTWLIAPAPSLTYRLSSAHRETRYGWYRSPVTLTFNCATAGLTLATRCPARVVLRANGRNPSLTRTIRATNGAAATVHVRSIKIDSRRPTVRIVGLAGRASYTAPSGVRCVASDRLAGIASCRVTRVDHDGMLTYTATATTRAGVTATRRITVRLS